MARQFFTEGTGNQQTLIPSQNEKVAVYDTVADAEADLANLSVGQIVATKDTGDELSQPVNVVEEGNLHAVTSNAVAEKIKTIELTKNSVAITTATTTGYRSQAFISDIVYDTNYNYILIGNTIEDVIVRDSIENSITNGKLCILCTAPKSITLTNLKIYGIAVKK